MRWFAEVLGRDVSRAAWLTIGRNLGRRLWSGGWRWMRELVTAAGGREEGRGGCLCGLGATGSRFATDVYRCNRFQARDSNRTVSFIASTSVSEF